MSTESIVGALTGLVDVLSKLLDVIKRKEELEDEYVKPYNGLPIRVKRDDGKEVPLADHLKPYTDEIAQLEARIRDGQQALPLIMDQLIPAIPSRVPIDLGWCHRLRERPTDSQVISEAIRMADRLRLELQRMQADGCARAVKDDIEDQEAKSVSHDQVGGEGKPTHAPDFTTVNWSGTAYDFDDGLQAKAIRELWKAWEDGGHGLSEKTIGEAIESADNNYRLEKTFRACVKPRCKASRGVKPPAKPAMHPAWGTMIEKVRAGVYRLKTP